VSSMCFTESILPTAPGMARWVQWREQTYAMDGKAGSLPENPVHRLKPTA
jgi:hypothetical protein